jgi:oxalate decarboxylase/phosphoglucose isomerase-like protein (cupin superfamily)
MSPRPSGLPWHCIENTGNTTRRLLEIFSDYYADVSLDQWLALTRQNWSARI